MILAYEPRFKENKTDAYDAECIENTSMKTKKSKITKWNKYCAVKIKSLERWSVEKFPLYEFQLT